MPIKQYTLNGRKIRKLDELYDQMTIHLALPSHFGRNLDALRDTLSADIEGPFEIIWEYAAYSREMMGKDFERVVTLLRTLEKERGDFKLKIDHQ